MKWFMIQIVEPRDGITDGLTTRTPRGFTSRLPFYAIRAVASGWMSGAQTRSCLSSLLFAGDTLSPLESLFSLAVHYGWEELKIAALIELFFHFIGAAPLNICYVLHHSLYSCASLHSFTALIYSLDYSLTHFRAHGNELHICPKKIQRIDSIPNLLGVSPQWSR